MKTNRKVYIVKSLKQEEFIIFGTEERAQKWIDTFTTSSYKRMVLDKSNKNDLYIIKRTIW